MIPSLDPALPGNTCYLPSRELPQLQECPYTVSEPRDTGLFA